MKSTLHSFWLTALLMLFCQSLFAYNFEVDGIYYEITSGTDLTVSVTKGNYDNSYSGDISIPSTVSYSGNTYNVTSIGNDAFKGCSGLTSINIPNSVTSIGNDAFKGCSGLKNVKIENGTTSLALGYMKNSNNSSYYYGLFKDCPIETLYLGRNLTYSTHSSSSSYPGYGCPFENISTLSIVTFGNYVTNIGNKAFSGCSGLTSVDIPTSVTRIGDNAFSDCTGLTSITIPNSVTYIGSWISAGCTNLQYNEYDNGLYLGNNENPYVALISVKSVEYTTCVVNPNCIIIADCAFFEDERLTSIYIPNSVTSIGEWAFEGCTNLVIFSGCQMEDGFVIYTENQKKYVLKYVGSATDIVLPQVDVIEKSVFKDHTELKSVTIPNSVTSIGNDAFIGCTSIKDVKFEDGTASLSLGDKLFKDCPIETLYLGRDLTYSTSPFQTVSTLSSVTIGNNVSNIGYYAFSGCTRLTSITIPNSVTSIGNSAFSGCIRLTSITIPNSVTSIGNSAFSGCIRLTSITIPNSVTSIGNSAFSGCTGLTDFDIPNSVTSIGSSAFRGCTGLTSIDIPNSITNIGSSVFQNCTGLTEFTIPQSVTSIGNDAFTGCTNIKNVKFEDGSASLSLGYKSNTQNSYFYYGLFKDCPIKTLFLGRNLTYSTHSYNSSYPGYGSPFENKSGVSSVTISNTVSSIERYAFYGCKGLTSIIIPSSVTSIKDNAFKDCNNLKKVYNSTTLAITKGSTSNGYVAYYGDYVYSNCQWDGDFIVTTNDSKKYVCGYKGTETNLVLPNVDGISEGAFYDYLVLTSVTLPKDLTFISGSAFDGCSGLQYNKYDNALYLGNEENPLLFLIKSKDKDISSCEINQDCRYIAEKAFYESTELKSIAIPSQVKDINNSAFQGCKNLKTIYNYSGLSLTKGSTSYGYVAYYADYVYKDCQDDGEYIYTLADGKKYICRYIGSKTDISLPEVDGISDYAFSNCPNLVNISIPNCVTGIATNAFEGCTSLKYNEYDNALYLGNEGNPCLALIKAKNTSVTLCLINQNCLSIANEAFKNCKSLKRVYNFSDLLISSGSTGNGYAGYYAEFVYNHCKMEGDYVLSAKGGKEYVCGYIGNDTELTLPEADGIDDGAFKNSNLSVVSIPNSVTSIGESAFYGCNKINYLIVPKNIESIGNNAFANCYNLKRVYNCSQLYLRSYSSDYGYVTNNAAYVYNYCQKEGDYVLTSDCGKKYVCGYIGKDSDLVLPEADGISSNAFNGSNALRSVSLSSNMESIGNYAFNNCSYLSSVSLPENLTNIGSYAFYNCYNLQDLVLPNSLTSIGNYAFYGCNSLTDISIPNGVTSIEGYTFYGCKRLTNVSFPNGLTNIDSYAFCGCTKLAEIVIPGSATNIGDYSFNECSGLANVVIKNGVTNIGNYAFYNCSGLTSISIPHSITSIGQYAFQNCTGTLSLNCETEDTEYISNSWFYRSKFTELVIGNDVNKIGKNAFNGLNTITKLTIGANVNRIGYSAFAGLTGLKGIYSNALTPPHCRDTAFDEDTKWDCPLYVPAVSLNDYKTADVWKDFLAINENTEYSGIESLTSEDKTSVPVHNLLGQKVTTPTKGKVYIQNGKKYVTK